MHPPHFLESLTLPRLLARDKGELCFDEEEEIVFFKSGIFFIPLFFSFHHSKKSQMGKFLTQTQIYDRVPTEIPKLFFRTLENIIT